MILSVRAYSPDIDGIIKNGIDLFNFHNQAVGNDDLVLFLGDVARLNSRTKKIFREMLPLMKGHKILIKGNHDKKSDQFYLDCGFEGVTDFLVIGRFFLCHYPLNEIHSSHEKHLLKICKKHKCDTIIHGHVHTEKVQNLSDKEFTRINVCVDYSEMIPTKFSERIFKTFGKNFLKKLKDPNHRLENSSDYFLTDPNEPNEPKNKGNFTKQFKNEYTITRDTSKRRKDYTFRYVA